MINLDEEKLKTYDCIILNEIEKNPDFSFNKLSNILKCSKSIIIDRIEELIESGLIIIDNEQFILTDNGKQLKLTTKIYSYDMENITTIGTDEFEWEIAYFPSEDIFD